MVEFVRNIKKYFSWKDLAIVFMAVVLSVSAGVGVFHYLKKDVEINDNGSLILVRTMKSTVGEALKQAGIDIREEDYISLPPDTQLQKLKKNEIYIKRAVPVTILADGQEINILTYRDTVREAIAYSPVTLSGMDRIEGVSLEDRIVEGMKIKVVRVREELQTESIPIPYKVVTRENNRMDKGTERILKDGQEGRREKLFKVVFEDGKEILRELLKDSIAAVPVDKIVEFGTILNHKTARGDVIRYSKVLNMRATSYTASFKDTGKNPDHPQFGITYTGIRVRKGVIAVDPKVIPLGTKVYVEVAGKTPDYGYAIAADIGGAIKGDLIDLYFDDQSFVDRWGVKKVKVYILTE